MNKKKVSAVIKKHEKLCEGIYSLWIETELAKDAMAGQFIGVYLNNPAKLLARPISICDVNEDKTQLRMVYRAAGEGTRELSGYPEGTKVDVIGVLGNGYSKAAGGLFEGKKVIIIGGGIGIPPMLLATKSIAGEKEVVLGYSNGDLFLEDEFVNEAEVHIATVDGSVGTKGTVIDAMKEDDVKGDVIIACGPMPMLRALKEYAAKNNMEAYISLEERMACGVGACLGCVCKTVKEDHHTHVNNTRICVEGPVFDAKEVEI